MALHIRSFGNRLSFEILRDEVVVGGLAYTSDMRSPSGNAAFSAAKAHVHGEDATIEARPSNSSTGKLRYDIKKKNRRIGKIEFDWKGKAEISLARVDGGEDEFDLKPKGVTDWWFRLERDRHPVCEIWPTVKYTADGYDFQIRGASQRMPPRILDELMVYAGFAANVYMAKMSGVMVRGRSG